MTEPENNPTDPFAEGFRQPPKSVSFSCFKYMARIMELRSFVSVFFGAIRASGDTASLIKALPSKSFRYKMSGYNLVQYDYAQHRQLMNEIMLSRAVETFDLYLIGILREIFLSKPEMLSSEASIDAAKLIELKDFNEIISYLCEKRLTDLSYKPLSDLNNYISSRTGITLFKSGEIFDTALLSSEIRNIIAHNDCISSEQFRYRTRSVDPALISLRQRDKKLLIDDSWLRKASYTLDSVVFDFDEAAVAKFSITQLYKIGG